MNAITRSPFFADNDETALALAAHKGHFGLVDLLLDWGADVNKPAWSAKTPRACTALQSAAAEGHLGIVKCLLEMDADVNPRRHFEGNPWNPKDPTPLEAAARRGHLDMVKLLLESGARISGSGCVQYATAVRYANEHGHGAVAELLTAHGGNLPAELPTECIYFHVRGSYNAGLFPSEFSPGELSDIIAEFTKARRWRARRVDGSIWPLKAWQLGVAIQVQRWADTVSTRSAATRAGLLDDAASVAKGAIQGWAAGSPKLQLEVAVSPEEKRFVWDAALVAAQALRSWAADRIASADRAMTAEAVDLEDAAYGLPDIQAVLDDGREGTNHWWEVPELDSRAPFPHIW